MSKHNREPSRTKYSVPRRETSGKPYCQTCFSHDHWTYQCTCEGKGNDSSSTKKTSHSTRLSPSQMLRLGIKRPRVEVVPEMSEREKFDADLKKIEKEIVHEILEERKRTKPTDEKEKKDNELGVVGGGKHQKGRPAKRNTEDLPDAPEGPRSRVKYEESDEDPTAASPDMS